MIKTRFYWFCIALLCVGRTVFADAPVPIKPLDVNGKPLNFDFETGTLKDWTAVGAAFDKQPVRGDTVFTRRSDMKSGHQGEYWIGTYEIAGDAPQGTLTSVPFEVTHPYASFLVAGGSGPNTRVELVNAKSGEVIFKTSGYDNEMLRPVVVQLDKHLGEEIFIRIVDDESGGWGHINFDDFEFYNGKPSLPNVLDPGSAGQAPEADHILYAGLSPEEAVQKMTLPPGFKATLFAGEPDVKQPIAFAIDDRGRLWVAEAYTYPVRAKEGQGHDRILVFEDTKGDGKFDKRTVFMEGLNLVSGLEVGFGGVWVGAAPYLMFIPMKDGKEPKPAGPPQILLDGFAYEDTHETLNTFTWGPDGWLYGCHGVFEHSNVGKPGAPDSERTPINCGVWRYHPTKHIFELFAEGTSNPWGIDFDEHGQCIIEACVIPHLFHMIQGGRFTRQAGSHFNPYVYDDIKTFADHVHWAGDKGPHAGNGRSAAAGGGHAHAGMLIYQGDNWPDEYVGKLFMNNIHGACINMDIPERVGSGFVGHHGKNLIDFNDTWSQIVNLEAGPDGAVYMIDWYDRLQCHNTDPNAPDRSNGRIFKIRYEGPPAPPAVSVPKDLSKESDEKLLMLQSGYGSVRGLDNWMTRHARRILQERAAAGRLNINVPEKISAMYKPDSLTEDQALRLLWAQQVTVGLAEPEALQKLKSQYEYVRAWTIQFLCENKTVSPEVLSEFVRLSREDESPVVRLYLASGMQRLPAEDRWDVVKSLCAHSEDANDHNLPLMVWYAAEPLPALDFVRALRVAEEAKLPNILQFTVRRTAALATPGAFAAIVKSLSRVDDDKRRMDILNGLSFALHGQRHAAMPAGWEKIESGLGASANSEIQTAVQSLSLTFGSVRALAELHKTLADRSADLAARRTALASLLGAKDRSLAPILRGLLTDNDLRGPALRGLAAYDEAENPPEILAGYSSFGAAEKRDALNTLAARVSSAKALLAAIGSGTVPRTDVNAEVVRQLRSLHDAELARLMEKVWGIARESSAGKKAQIEKYKKVFWAGGSTPGDASRGRLVFSHTCQQCHTLFDTGGKVGPELTGSNRADLNYILENIVDPNAIIPNDYRAWTLETSDDRTITGIVRQQDEKSVTIVTPNETLTVPRKEIASLKQSALSMMPEGLLDNLKDQEVRDLLYYLSRPGQVPMPATANP